MIRENKQVFDCLVSAQYLYQKLLKSDNTSSNYLESFLRHSVVHTSKHYDHSETPNQFACSA